MAKRGPGKFDSDLDAALYALTLDGGPDEEVGSSTEAPGTWAGLMRGGLELGQALEERMGDGEPFTLLRRADFAFLREDGRAGVIICEATSGAVDVAYYDDPKKLERDWKECVEDLSIDDEEFEGNARPTRRRNGEEDILRDETIEPFLEGKGPVFRIQTWETGKFDQHRLRRDRPMLGYRITMTEPGGSPEVVYEGEDYSPGAGTDPASDQTLNDILAFFTSDSYDDEDDPRTARGKEVAAKYSDYLSGFFEEREENRGGRQRPNGQARFRVYLGDDLTDTVYFHDDMSEDEVRRSLIDHDGYDSRITVKKVEPRRTGIPASRYVENRTWRRAHINDLPDGAFLYIEPGGHKDSDGRTVPRTLRHFPYKDAGGHIDTAHLKNALSRIPQSSLPADVRRRVQERAQALYAGRK